MENMTLNQSKIKQVTDASKTATATMILLGFRLRARTTTSMSKIKDQLIDMKEDIVDKDFMDFWKGLESAGAGSIILGRRGRQTRFEWNYSLLEVAKLAIEGREEEIKKLESKRKGPKPFLKVVPEKAVKEEVKGAGLKVAEGIRAIKPKDGKYGGVVEIASRQEKLVFRIPLRPDFTLEVNLPADVSVTELEKIRNSFTANG